MQTLALLLLVLFTHSLSAAQTLTPYEERPLAPDFTLKSMEGEVIRLADYRGKVLVINFWAVWCGPCREEMPSLDRAAKWLDRFGAKLIAINVGERREQVARYLEKNPLGFPVALDPDTATAVSWGVENYPATFVVDPEGRIAYRALGKRDWDPPGLLIPIRALGM